MADIELVIKIPEELHKRIQSAKSVPDLSGTDIVNAITSMRTGILLPKVLKNRLVKNGDKWINIAEDLMPIIDEAESKE